jgi:chlorophyllase
MKLASSYVICLCAMLALLAGCGSDSPAESSKSSEDAGQNTLDVGQNASDAGDSAAPIDADTTDSAVDDATINEPSDTLDTLATEDTDGTEDSDGAEDVQDAGDGLYLGVEDPYGAGDLSVSVIDVAAAQAGAPVAMQIYEPEQSGSYAVVVFQHGFQMKNGYYSTILEHVSSHGFIVVAPQMSGGSLLGSPSTQEEADEAKALYDWLEVELAGQISTSPSLDHVGLVGHSRGAKVVWSVMSDDPSYADALVGIDPVDGTGGPFGGEDRVIDGPFGFSPPVFVLGTGLGPQASFGQACAPSGDNHEQFYSASQTPAWHVVATQHGHLDMLDDQTPGCGAACGLCPSGDDKPTMRTLTAGTLVAFLRASLQGDDTAYGLLSDLGAAPTPVEVEQK